MPLPHPDLAASTVGCAVLTVSDTRTPETDKSGQILQAKLTAAHHQVGSLRDIARRAEGSEAASSDLGD